MVYDDDTQASEEAARYALSASALDELRGQTAVKSEQLGLGGCRNHTVRIDPTSWHGLMPDELAGRDNISRGDVFDMAAHPRNLTSVFAASFIWGTGRIGYGPRRLREIVDGAGGNLESSLVAAKVTADTDLIEGYATLYGGHDPKHRVAAQTPPYVRIDRYGPAFFTKFLYFTTPGALILDNVLANAVHGLTQMPHLVARNGKPYAWSPYRYAVYLHWMNATAASVGVTPELLEFTLFNS